jgi:predicted Fe-S protein YdhL (DUF1289 family)
MNAKLSNHASALGRHGAKTRWQNTSPDERARVMELVRNGKAKRAREGKQPQTDNFAIANAVLLRQNQRSQEKER